MPVLQSVSRVVSVLGFVLAMGVGARADDVEPAIKNGIPESSIATALPNNGDPGGVRKALSERGVTYTLIYTSEVLSNVTGGLKRGTLYEGRLDAQFNADLEKLLGWKGLSFYSNLYQIHGTAGARRNYLDSLNTVSNIEGLPSTRLGEFWVEQKFFDDSVSVRFGQLASDTEFHVSSTSEIFFTSGWPTILAADLLSGGPVYPLSTPGIRLKIEPTKQFAFLVGLFNGDPAGPGPEAPEEKNRNGLNFRVNDPPFLIAEAQYKYNQGAALPGTIKLGGWHHFGSYDDMRFDTNGLPLADPASNGVPKSHRGISGFYGIIDQKIYRPPGGSDDQGISVYGRVSTAMPSDRNYVDLYMDGGIVFAGMIPTRPNDKFGASVLYTRISEAARDFDRDTIAYTGVAQPVHDYEMTFELTYQAHIRPGWSIQPNVQYMIHPGANAPDPGDPTSPVKNALLLGVRSVLQY